MNTIKKAIIPIAGNGSRLLPITKTISKAMFPLINKPVIHYLIEEAISAKIQEIILIISPFQTDIRDYLNNNSEYIKQYNHYSKELENLNNLFNKIKITYIIQEKPKGLYDAICLAKDYIGNEDFAVMLGDDFILNNNKKEYGLGSLCKLYQSSPNYYVAIKKVSTENTNKYGIINPIYVNDKFVKIQGVIEKPKINPPSNLAIIGRYILRPSIFTITNIIQPGINNELQLSDALSKINESVEIFAAPIDGVSFDIGDKEDYVNAINAVFKSQIYE